MKTLYLVRHAKSSRDDPGLPDRQRPLTPRGERDAATMGHRLRQGHGQPGLIVSSPALRALATARRMAEALDCAPGQLLLDERLYAATMATLLAVVEAIDDKPQCVMLVGHNPEITELAHRFASDIMHMPTCAIAEFAFDARRWSGIGRAKPVRAAFDAPKHSPT